MLYINIKPSQRQFFELLNGHTYTVVCYDESSSGRSTQITEVISKYRNAYSVVWRFKSKVHAFKLT